jgi:hypothetical protein
VSFGEANVNLGTKTFVGVLMLALSVFVSMRLNHDDSDGQERLLAQVTARDAALERELSALRSELRAERGRARREETVRGSARAEPVLKGAAAGPKPAENADAAGETLEQADDEAQVRAERSERAQEAGQKLLEEALADGMWDRERALAFRAQLMHVTGEEHAALAQALTRRINEGVIVPEPGTHTLF